MPENEVRSMLKALLVFAHPDDETIAVGAAAAASSGADRFPGWNLLAHLPGGADSRGTATTPGGWHASPVHARDRMAK